jgi:hypothetical protein
MLDRQLDAAAGKVRLRFARAQSSQREPVDHAALALDEQPDRLVSIRETHHDSRPGIRAFGDIAEPQVGDRPADRLAQPRRRQRGPTARNVQHHRSIIPDRPRRPATRRRLLRPV